MNFLKKAGAILLLVAVFASSCNKYADDFKQLNTKLDALATQVAGVTTLTADMTTLKASVATLQTAIAALPKTSDITALGTSLTAITTKVDALTATLKTVADNGVATKAVVDGLKTSLSDLAALTAADDKKLTDAIAALANTDVEQNKALTALKDQNTELAKAVADVQAKLTTSSDATAASIAALQVLLNAQKVQLDQIILNTSMYNGDVIITTDAEVTFFLAKIAQLGIINGDLKINKASISAGQLANVDMITSKIMNVIGTGNVTIDFKAGDAINLSKLVSAKGNVTVTGTAKGAGADVDLSSLSSVGGNLILNYDGPYASASLTKVGGDLRLVNKAVVAATTPLGTTAINIPSVTVTGNVYDVAVAGAAGVLNFPLATDIAMAGGVVSLNSTGGVSKATSIKLNTTSYATPLTILASTTAAATIDLSAATNITGAASITGFGATAVNLSGLVTAPAGLTVITGTTGTVDLTKYNEPVGALVVTGPKTLVLPAMVAGSINALNAETVTLAKHEWAAVPAATLPAVKNLTLGNLANTINLAAYPTLVTVDISGKAQTTWAATAPSVVNTVGNAALTTVKLGGNIGTASFSTCPLLTSFTTAGSVNSLTVDAMAALTALNLGHTYFVPTNAANGGPGSDLIITNNPKITALKSSGDYPRTITVTGNALLTSLDLSSYVTKLLPAVGAMTTITINTNKLSGSYTNAVAMTATTPYVETTITSADLHTLKALVASYPSVAPFLPGITLSIDLDAVKIGSGAATSLSAKMNLGVGNDVSSTTIDAIGGINLQKEFALVQ